MSAVKAKLMRLREIEKLQACNCYYPVLVSRNMCGHQGDCPAYKIWERHIAEDSSR